MYKLNQLVLLPCHETIGRIVFKDFESDKMVIRVSPEINHRELKAYDVQTTVDGFLPHTKVSIVEPLFFHENENVYIKSLDGTIDIGKISSIRVSKYPNSDIVVLIADFCSPNRVSAVELNKCYKLFNLKKQIDKLVRENDKFARNVIEK